MSDETKTSPAYTAREVVEILEKAKALGVVSIKLPGFEAAWKFTKATSEATPQPTEAEPKSNGQATCETCGETLTEGEYGLYCRGCYIRRKEQRFQKTRKW